MIHVLSRLRTFKKTLGVLCQPKKLVASVVLHKSANRKENDSVHVRGPTMEKSTNSPKRCLFCFKTEQEVKYLVSLDDDQALFGICGDCTVQAAQIIAQQALESQKGSASPQSPIAGDSR